MAGAMPRQIKAVLRPSHMTAPPFGMGAVLIGGTDGELNLMRSTVQRDVG